MSLTFDVSNCGTVVRLEHIQNMEPMLVTFEVSNSGTVVIFEQE